MNPNKIFGYSLILLGLIIILGTLYSSYKIFTDQAPVPKIFFAVSKDNSSLGNKSLDLQKQMDDAIKKQISEILPFGSLPQILNLISWSILAGILIFGGGQIAGIGIKLVKT